VAKQSFSIMVRHAQFTDKGLSRRSPNSEWLGEEFFARSALRISTPSDLLNRDHPRHLEKTSAVPINCPSQLDMYKPPPFTE
jgi:hypothetical protein